MNSKTFLFNKSIIKSDFKRFWWVSAVLMLFLALFVLPRAVVNDSYPLSFRDSIYVRTDEGVLAWFAGFFLSGLIFSYLHKANSVSCIHGLPLTRMKQYFSHIFSGAVLLIIPVAIASGVIFIECICLNTGEMFALKESVKYFYVSGVYALAAFMVTLFAVMLSGNTIAAYVFSFAFVVIPGFFISIVAYIFEKNLYGFYSDSVVLGEILNKIYIFGTDDMWSKNSLLYIALIIVLLIVCLVIYKYRSLENYDEIIAFGFLRPVFMYVAAVCFGYFGAALINSIWDVNTLFLGTLPLGIAALAAAFMLNRKSFGIKGLLKPVIIFVLGVGIVKLGFLTDITGFERYVPDIDDIASIEPYEEVDNSCENVYLNEKDGEYDMLINKGIDTMSFYNEVKGRSEFTDSENIENIVGLHKAIISNRKLERDRDSEQYKDGSENFSIKYNLKNGKVIRRAYSVPKSTYKDYTVKYYENDVYKKARFPFFNDAPKKIDYVEYNGLFGNLRLQNIDYDKLTQAIKADVKALDYEGIKYVNNHRGTDIHSISINYTVEVEKDGRKFEYKGSTDFELNSYFKNTAAIVQPQLQKYGTVTSGQISGVYIEAMPYDEDEEGYHRSNMKNYNITNEAEARALFNALTVIGYSDNTNSDSVSRELYITFTKGGNEVVGVSCCRQYNEYPPEARKYLDMADKEYKQGGDKGE